MPVQLFYGAAVFVSSACALVIEIVAGRLLAPYVGMSLYTWTAIIAVVLAGLSVGHWIGGRLAAPHINGRQGNRRVAAALALAAGSTLAILVLLRTVSGWLLGGDLGTVPAIILLSGAVFFLPSLFAGIVSPILTKLAVDRSPGDHGRVIGVMYALGTLGSIAGTLAAGYLFISWIGSNGTVIAVAVVYTLLALLFAIADRLRLVLVLAMAAVGGSLTWAGQQTGALRSPCQVESDYFCIRTDDFSTQSGRPSRLMVLDHLVHSINDRDDPGLLYSPYIHFVDEMARHRWRDRTTGGALFRPKGFFIGGGGYSLPRAWASDYPGAELLVAELDPKVTMVASRELWLPKNAPEIIIRHRDARVLLQSLPPQPRFDVIFGDAFHDISIPPHLVTREFHGEIARRLAPGGFYAVNVVDQGRQPRFLLSLIKTLRLHFASVEAWAEGGELGGTGRVTFIVIAAEAPSDSSFLTAGRGLERRWLRWPVDDLGARLADASLPILSDDFAPVDRLMMGLLLDGLP